MNNFTPNANFKYYMYFIAERMNIFWAKYYGFNKPYTDDDILREHKFTNVYRVLDRASQYLLKNVIYNGKSYSKEEMFWRILIYKHFNLPNTWDLLIKKFGDITKDVSLDEISDYLVECIDNGETLYSNAYMMTSAFLSGNKGRYTHLKVNKWRKHQYYFYIFKEELIRENKLEGILNATSLEDMFNKMSAVTSFGAFTSYQYVQDLNYTEFFDFDDNSFIAAGPGTQRGAQRVFDIEGKADYQVIVKWIQENFDGLIKKYDINFISLPNHKPTVADLSNCLCEVDKYLRGLGVETKGKNISGKRIKQVFKENTNKIDFVFPPKWGVGKLQNI